MAPDHSDDDADTDRARLLRAGLLALQPLLETDRLTLWRVLPQCARLVRGLVEGDDAQLAEPAWRAHEAELRQGHAVGSPEASYHPLRVDGELVGFLQACARPVPLGPGARAFMQRVLDDVAEALIAPDVPRREDGGDGGLREAVRRPAMARLVPAPAAGPGDAGELRALRERKFEEERAFLLKKLAECGWSFAKVARRLGCRRSTIWRRTKRFNIERPERSPMDRRPRDGES